MTNLLIFDPDHACGALLRAYLRTQGHRISIASEGADLVLKLQTGLFDGVLFVSPTVDPSLQQIDASNLSVATLSRDRIEANLPDGRRLVRPRHLSSISEVVQSLRRDADRELHPAQLNHGDRVVECRATELRMPSLWVEPVRGHEDPFTEFFRTVQEATFLTRIQLTRKETLEGSCRCLYAEHTISGAIERAAIRIDSP